MSEELSEVEKSYREKQVNGNGTVDTKYTRESKLTADEKKHLKEYGVVLEIKYKDIGQPDLKPKE